MSRVCGLSGVDLRARETRLTSLPLRSIDSPLNIASHFYAHSGDNIFFLYSVLSREYEATQNTLGRHGHSNPAEHEQRMAKAQADRVAGLKANSELEHALSRAQTELELLKNELADEEADAVDVGVLNSEV